MALVWISRDGEEVQVDDSELPVGIPPTFAYILTKLQITDRMSDEQLDQFDALLSGQTTRLRRAWADATEVSSTHPFFAVLRQHMLDAWGEAEADRILRDPSDAGIESPPGMNPPADNTDPAAWNAEPEEPQLPLE